MSYSHKNGTNSDTRFSNLATDAEENGVSASSSRAVSHSTSTSPQNQDPQVQSTSQRNNSRATPTVKPKASSNDKDSESNDVDLDGSVIPPLSHVVIKSVIGINDALIKVCLEFQNKNWTNEPDYAIYQRRLQSNLTYLAAVADFYLDPKKGYDKFAAPLDMTPFPAPRIRSAKVLNSLLFNANAVFKSKSMAIDPRLNLHDKVAAVRASDSMAREALPGAITVDPSIPNPSPHDVYSAHKVYDPPASECGLESYVPFPPFRLPSEIKLPFEP